MNKEEESPEKKVLNEDLLEFEFGDLPAEENEGTNGNPDTEEEIIELVDVVEEGDVLKDLDSELDHLTIDMESEDLLKEMDEETSAEFSFDTDSDPEALPKDTEPSEKPDPELKIEDSDLESLANDEAVLELEDLVKPEDIEGEAYEGMPAEKKEGSTEEVTVSESEASQQAFAAPPASEQLIGISEEKIEAIIKTVVENVVEKVARETMVSVAEKMIGEAIDDLKKSLESLSD